MATNNGADFPTPGVLRPIDPTKYAGTSSTIQTSVMKTAEETNIKKMHPAEGNSTYVMGQDTGKEQVAKKEHNVEVTKTEKRRNGKSKLSTETAAEAESKSDVTECHPDETLRLASLRMVKKIHTMRLNKRYMELAEIDGWTCLVPPRAFREGEIVLYFENDSFLPASDHRFAKLKPLQTFEGKLGFRVKTRRLGTDELRIVTQGYVYPVQKFPEIWNEVSIVREVVQMGSWDSSERTVNLTVLAIYRMTNWAEKLGIKKWVETQLAQPLSEHPRLGSFPKNIFSATDITRLQDCPNLFWKPKYQERVYQESIKLDGTSMTMYFTKKNSRYFEELSPLPEKVGPNTVLTNGRFGVCSKKVDLNELSPCSVGYWKIALQYDLPAKLSRAGRNVAISGELCGDGINGNREGITGGKKEFFVYSMFDIDRQKYLNPREVVTRATQLCLKHVPVLGYVKIPEVAERHGDLQKRADEKEGEGLVFKCLKDGRSFKVLSNSYLEKHDL
ncbi:hypothetical protein VP1G_08813 [Cytospora mali]|uniref:RNA ligase domain-containing protein n=1 Tax=Cytospora mali TaxID=578113 RepID=A0A194VCC9_CYTMA|nr:hypothetical protein VP1G_08813 [Valsa mali var. pyri (nom. inval.)]